jgi:hypothetical protein
MFKYLIILLFAFSLGCQKKASIQFDDLFVFERYIPFSADLGISEVKTLDVDGKERMLITDRAKRKVLILDSKGTLLQKLDPEPCSPGFNWQPVGARFNPKGGIFVMMETKQGFWFKDDGTCLGKIDIEAYTSKSFSIGDKGEILLYYAAAKGVTITTLDSLGQIMRKFIVQSKFPVLNSKLSMGYVWPRGDHIILGIPGEPLALEYNNVGAKLKDIGTSPSYFRAFKSDVLVFGSPQDIMDQVKGSTQTIGLWFADSSKTKVLINYTNGYMPYPSKKEIGIQVCDIASNNCTDELLTNRTGAFILGKDGYFYNQMDLEHQKKLGWGIGIYRIKSTPN